MTYDERRGHLGLEGQELVEPVAHAGHLAGADAGERVGVEEDRDRLLVAVRRERDVLAELVAQGEVGRWSPELESGHVTILSLGSDAARIGRAGQRASGC